MTAPSVNDLTAQTLSLADGRTLAWAQWGPVDGTPVLFLHGTPGGRFNRGADDALLDRLGVRLLIPDRPGYGISDPEPARTVLSFAEDLVALLDHLGHTRLAVMGASGGGPHALGLGVLAPERVSVIGVMAGAVRLTAAEAEGQVQLNRTVLAALNSRDDLERVLNDSREQIFSKGLIALLADIPSEDAKALAVGPAAERAVEMLAKSLAPGIAGWRDDYLALWSRPWGFEARDVRSPVLWWHGDVDRNVPVAAAQRFAAGLPDVTLRVQSGGHLAGREHAAEMWAALFAQALKAQDPR